MLNSIVHLTKRQFWLSWLMDMQAIKGIDYMQWSDLVVIWKVLCKCYSIFWCFKVACKISIAPKNSKNDDSSKFHVVATNALKQPWFHHVEPLLKKCSKTLTIVDTCVQSANVCIVPSWSGHIFPSAIVAQILDGR
jgi:hypothetical protein